MINQKISDNISRKKNPRIKTKKLYLAKAMVKAQLLSRHEASHRRLKGGGKSKGWMRLCNKITKNFFLVCIIRNLPSETKVWE